MHGELGRMSEYCTVVCQMYFMDVGLNPRIY